MQASLPGAESVRLDISAFNSTPTASGYSQTEHDCDTLSLSLSLSLYIYIYIYIYIQEHLKKLEYHEKGQYFLSLISESETHILYRFITHSVKYFKPLFLETLIIMAYR